MSRNFFNIVAMVCWVCLLAALFASWGELVRMGKSLAGHDYREVVAAGLFVASLVVAFLLHVGLSNTIVSDGADYAAMGPEERRRRAEREALTAIKHRRPGQALLIYEEQGMYGKAMEVAQDINDLPAQARLSQKLGHFSRARRLYENMGDFASAGHMALKMDSLEEARGLYRQAAEACRRRNGTPEEEAGLWERAREYGQAAELYEEGGELEKAGECYALLGDSRNAARCREQARALAAYERRQSGLSTAALAKKQEDERTAAGNQAREAEERGDYLAAGLLYRKAQQWFEAGQALERVEEWERAAEAFREAGLDDRAEMAMMRVEPKEGVEEEEAESGSNASTGFNPPSPQTAGGGKGFQPISEAMAVPVYIAASGKDAPNPAANEAMVQHLRRGEFLEAAEKAIEGNNWILAGAFFEHAGKAMRAADTYRQIGRNDEAIECLRRAGHAREAALIHLAEGERDEALALLLESLGEAGSVDPQAAMLLMEMLVDLGKVSEALALLRKRIAPQGPNAQTAPLFYRTARLLENREHPREALECYRMLQQAGAESTALTEKMQGLETRLAEEPATEAESKQATQALSEEQERAFSEIITQVLGDGGEDRTELLGEPVGERTVTFAFEPPSEDFDPWAGEQGGLGPAAANLSLFGVPPTLPAEGGQGLDQYLERADDSNAPIAGIGAKQETERSETAFNEGGRYDIRREIARGGMGVVYEAMDTVLHRPVALKLVLSQHATPKALRQFMLEARAIAQLNHPNVVLIFDMGLMQMRHYIAMEMIQGGSLTSYLKEKKQLDFYEALRIFVETARGLQAAHEAGIVHRDIKPGNILLTDRQQVKIVDFGLAKIRQEEQDGAERTMFRSSGTPGYMATEQIRGEALEPRCDIYALGITLFYMLVGKPPHRIAKIEKDFDILKFQVEGKLPSLKEFRPETPSAIDKLYRYCTAADPEKRYQTVDAFLDTAERWMMKYKAEALGEEPLAPA